MQLLDAPVSSSSLSQTSSDILFGDRNPALLRTDIADCLLRIEYSVRLIIRKMEQVVMHWNAVLFQVAYGWTIYRPVCLYPHTKLRWNYNPVQFANKAYQFQYKPHSAASNYLCLFVWANLWILFIIYFKPSFSNRAETELKCNTGIWKTMYHWHFIIYRQLMLSPF